VSEAEKVLAETIRPVLGYLWTEHRVPNGPAAEAMMVAIGLQESRFLRRDQVVPGKRPGQIGPATGFWQFERDGGVAAVMTSAVTRDIARKIAGAAGVAWDRDAIWRAFVRPEGDQLAAAFARLLLFSDPAPLPAPSAAAEEAAWAYYVRNWRPGRPHRETWGRFWAAALALVGAAPVAENAIDRRLAALEARVAALEVRLASKP
jgi:hypothetical protein